MADKTRDKTSRKSGTNRNKPAEPWCKIHSMYCGPCYHRNRQRIDQQMVDRTPYRVILRENPDLSLGALSRHRAHIREALGEAMALRAGESAERGANLANRVESLLDEAKAILSTAKTKENLTAAVAAVNACTRLLELVGHLDGSLVRSNANVHLTLNKVTNTTTVYNYGDDTELAALVGEATKGFSVDELMRLKAIAEAAAVQPACNGLPSSLNSQE